MSYALPSPEELTSVPDLWRSVPRRWGHPLHSLCSYFAMFPPQMARVLIDWLTYPGDTVYDPFSGRGTVALEALLLGRTCFSSDANPLAEVLSRAKTTIPSHTEVLSRLAALERAHHLELIDTSNIPDKIKMLYSKNTLAQLQFLRIQLDRCCPVDNFITAMILGMMHANHGKAGATRGFSISMPNTFAMSPGYVAKYITENDLKKPEVNVFQMLRNRVDRLGLPRDGVAGGKSWLHDATLPSDSFNYGQKPRLVLTSPPYLEVIRYGKYNWVRLWFLGMEPHDVDKKLMATSSLERYLDFMRSVCTSLERTVDPEGFVCFVIGDVRQKKCNEDRQINLADEVWQHVAKPMGWQLHASIEDALPQGRKVSRIWKHGKGMATKTDRILVLSVSENALPPLKPIDWRVASLDRSGDR